MGDEALRDEINKRLTLNWLIQGASQHAGLTFHHLVRDEFNALDPRLLRLYDQFALINLLQYWQFEAAVLLGWPSRFWRRAASSRQHPFFTHPLLSQFGGMLAAAARQRALERSKGKGLTRVPLLFSLQAMYLISRLRRLEAPHRPKLIQLARRAASTVWGIAIERLDADMAVGPACRDLIPAHGFRGEILRASIVGYGHVVRRGDSLMVVARGTNWQVLTKELVKGTAELVCLHGLSRLSDESYRRVLQDADHIEFEPWMLQTGGELWRRVLALIPTGQPVARVLMHLALLPPKSLEALIRAVIERPDWARELLAGLSDETEANAP